MERSFALQTAGRKREDKSAPPGRQRGLGTAGHSSQPLLQPRRVGGSRSQCGLGPGAKNVPCHLPHGRSYLRPGFLLIIPLGSLSGGAGGLSKAFVKLSIPELQPSPSPLQHPALPPPWVSLQLFPKSGTPSIPSGNYPTPHACCFLALPGHTFLLPAAVEARPGLLCHVKKGSF